MARNVRKQWQFPFLLIAKCKMIDFHVSLHYFKKNLKTVWLVQETEQCNYSGGPKHAVREGEKRNKQP